MQKQGQSSLVLLQARVYGHVASSVLLLTVAAHTQQHTQAYSKLVLAVLAVRRKWCGQHQYDATATATTTAPAPATPAAAAPRQVLHAHSV
jgi:hypothetical protein